MHPLYYPRQRVALGERVRRTRSQAFSRLRDRRACDRETVRRSWMRVSRWNLNISLVSLEEETKFSLSRRSAVSHPGIPHQRRSRPRRRRELTKSPTALAQPSGPSPQNHPRSRLTFNYLILRPCSSGFSFLFKHDDNKLLRGSFTTTVFFQSLKQCRLSGGY